MVKNFKSPNIIVHIIKAENQGGIGRSNESSVPHHWNSHHFEMLKYICAIDFRA